MFDPRYRDFPYASLTMAVVPFAVLMLNRPQIGAASDRGIGIRRAARAGGRLCRFNEGRENWQSLWTCAIYLAVRVHAVAGAGRANPRMSRPIARPDSTTL